MLNVLIHGGEGRYRAYSADLLAGLAGYETAEEFVRAAEEDLTMFDLAVSRCDAIDEEPGLSPDAKKRLRDRIHAGGGDLLPSPHEVRHARKTAQFNSSYLAGMGAVLLQAWGHSKLRERLSARAVTLASSVALALSAGALAPAHADGLSRFAKDALGASIGGALGSKIGDGRGKKIATVVGAVTGLVIAEGLQADKPTSAPIQLTGPAPSLPPGGVELTADRRQKLQAMQDSYSQDRGAYAGALYSQLHAQDELTLSPHDGVASRALASAMRASEEKGRKYGQSRADFVMAVEYMAKRGYDTREYALAHAMAYSPVTAKDVPRSALGLVASPDYPPAAATYTP